jgi:hypothetical protein
LRSVQSDNKVTGDVGFTARTQSDSIESPAAGAEAFMELYISESTLGNVPMAVHMGLSMGFSQCGERKGEGEEGETEECG